MSIRDYVGLPLLLGFLLALVGSIALPPSLCQAEEASSAASSEEYSTTEEGLEVAENEAAASVPLSLEQETAYTINTLIMLLCAVLVFFMQAGFAILEAGMNSAKNAVNILFKNAMDLGIGVLLFLFLGYGLMYPGTDRTNKIFAYGGAMVERDDFVEEGKTVSSSTVGDYSNSAHFIFQVAFAAAAATIVSGAVAGRMKFGAYLVYSALLTGLIYPISGYWKWGGGFLDGWGFQDFAGSVVVHAVGGFAGLAGALVLGPRLGRFTKEGKSVPMPGHNLTFATLGVIILWVGWYGFNAGSQLTYFGAENAEATTYIALTTTLAAAAGAVSSMLLGWLLFKKPDLTMALNGILAGLVGITANCDQVTQFGAILIGGIAGLLVVSGILLLDKLRIDDPVGAWPVHGLCGIWGGIATGIFGQNIPEVLNNSRAAYIAAQIKGSVIIAIWAFVTMFALFYLLKRLGFLRVSAKEEREGLDLSEHGMHAYPPSLVVDSFGSSSPAPPR